MNNKHLIFCFLCVAFIGIAFYTSGCPQQAGTSRNINDSLTLPQILKQVLVSYPTIAKAQEAIQLAEANIGLAKSGYYPVIDASGSFTRIGPVPSFTVPGMGSFNFAPENNYNLSANVYETIYDFEKTARKIKLEESTKELSGKNVELIKQKLTLLTSISYYSLIYLQEAIKIKENQILTLKKHLDFVTKKEATGSSTQYEILTTKVRLSNTENQKVDLETAGQTQMAILNGLMGLPVNSPVVVKSTFLTTKPDINPDSLITYALEHRYEMEMAKLRQKHAELHLRSVKVQNNPTLNAFVTGGFKNGYFPDLNKFTPNYVAGIGMTVPLFDATRHKYNMRLVNSEINIAKQDIDQSTRDISIEVYQNQTSLLASLKKIDQSELQVKQAEEALNLATVSFKSGVITNLDLLDSETSLEESMVNLLRAKIELAINLVRLSISLGKPIE